MSRESLVIVLGLIVFFTPSLGIPDHWKTYVISASGMLLLIIGYMLRRSAYIRSTETGSGERATDSFVESRPRIEHLSEDVHS